MFIKQLLNKLKNYKMAKKDTRYLFRVEKEIINKLKIIAAKKSVSVSELIRISLKEKYSI